MVTYYMKTSGRWGSGFHSGSEVNFDDRDYDISNEFLSEPVNIAKYVASGIPVTIYNNIGNKGDGLLPDSTDTVIFQIDAGANVGFSQETFIFSEKDVLPGASSVEKKIPLVPNGTIKTAIMVIEDSNGPLPIKGNDANNILNGTDANNLIYAKKGNDKVYGKGGNDTLYGEAGADTLFGGLGADEIYGGSGNDKLNGDDGNDYLHGVDGNDSLNGGKGNDELVGGKGNDTLLGGEGNDTLYGDAGSDTLYGDAGNDVLYGDAGNNILYGDAGNDTLYGDGGNNTMYGGSGNDYYIVDSVSDTVVEYQKSGVDTVEASISYTLGSYVDHLKLTGYDETTGQYTAINGYGNEMSNRITGNDASNYLFGYGGNDTLIGGYSDFSDDYLSGGDGSDRLEGDYGNDTVVGGTGADTFVFNSRFEGIDIIQDFNYIEGDTVEVSASGFGIVLGANQYDNFSFDNSTGALSYNGTQFASIQLGSGFVISLDITIV